MMGYSHGFVASVINSKNNRPIRELTGEGNKRTAALPFGTEYKIRLKNKNNVRCQVEVYIDGTDVLHGSRIILNAGESMDLERFLENDQKGSRFKFDSIKSAAASGQLQDPDDPENGKIEVKFFREFIPNTTMYYSSGSTPRRGGAGGSSAGGTGILRGASCGSDISFNSAQSLTTNYNNSSDSGVRAVMDSMEVVPQEAKGVTVEGSESNQKFSVGDDFPVEHTPTTIEIMLSAPSHSSYSSHATPGGFAVRVVNGKDFEVLMNGSRFPGNYKVTISDGQLSLKGSNIDVRTRDYVMI